MDQTTNAPPIQIANMGDPSGRSLVTTGRINRTSAGTAGTQSGCPADLHGHVCPRGRSLAARKFSDETGTGKLRRHIAFIGRQLP